MARLFGIGNKPKVFEFKCSDCGEIHHGSPSFAYSKPALFFDIPEDQRKDRIKISDDICEIRGPSEGPDEPSHFFIRVTLDIPIKDVIAPFTWGVWVTQSNDNFERYVDTFDADQSGVKTFGWLTVAMTPYKRTKPGEDLENLPCTVLWRPPKDGVGQRPQIEIQECDHPLYFDQQNGLSWEDAINIARQVIHGEKK